MMKLTVIICDPAPVAVLDEPCGLRRVTFDLTPYQEAQIELRETGHSCGARITEHISRCFLELDKLTQRTKIVAEMQILARRLCAREDAQGPFRGLRRIFVCTRVRFSGHGSGLDLFLKRERSFEGFDGIGGLISLRLASASTRTQDPRRPIPAETDRVASSRRDRDRQNQALDRRPTRSARHRPSYPSEKPPTRSTTLPA